jgi:hypothetical protein
MIEMENMLVMLENIEVKLVKGMMYNHFDLKQKEIKQFYKIK